MMPSNNQALSGTARVARLGSSPGGGKGGKSQDILQEIGSELKSNEPRIVRMTRQKYGPERAIAQKRAILLSKARKAGASVPNPLSQPKRGI